MIASIFPPKDGQVTAPGEWFSAKIESPPPTEEQVYDKVHAIFGALAAKTADEEKRRRKHHG